jgi:hypothetical protein
MVAGDSVVWSFQEKRKSRRKWKIDFFFIFFYFFPLFSMLNRSG